MQQQQKKVSLFNDNIIKFCYDKNGELVSVRIGCTWEKVALHVL